MNATIDITGVTIKTERLVLRPFCEEDLDDFYEYAKVDGVGQMAGWLPHQNKEESARILRSFIDGKKTFAIVKDGKTIGSLGVEKYGMEDRLTEFDGYQGRELGYVLSKAYWGQGLMTEAVQAVIKYLFERLELDFLLCGYYDFNKRSRRVQEKCGFKPYRKLIMETRMGTKEPSVLNLITNPTKEIVFKFSHPETLID